MADWNILYLPLPAGLVFSWQIMIFCFCHYQQAWFSHGKSVYSIFATISLPRLLVANHYILLLPLPACLDY